MNKKICVSAIGIENKKVYLAHKKGKWGPECEGSDHEKHLLVLEGDEFVYLADCLEVGEEFKIVIPVSGEKEAKEIFALRIEKGVHVSERFDFDAHHNTFWLLAHTYPVVRPMKWNQNNIFCVCVR